MPGVIIVVAKDDVGGGGGTGGGGSLGISIHVLCCTSLYGTTYSLRDESNSFATKKSTCRPNFTIVYLEFGLVFGLELCWDNDVKLNGKARC